MVFRTQQTRWGKKRKTSPTFTPDPTFHGPSEEDEQVAVFDWLKWLQHPAKDYAFAIPNQVGGRPSKTTLRARARIGVKKGVPDLMLAYPCNGWAGLFIELKVGNGKASPEQLEWLARLKAVGYYTALCYGSKEAISLIIAYLGISDYVRR